MSEFAWFRLIIRAIGILLLGLAVPDVIRTILMTVSYLTDELYSGPSTVWIIASSAGYTVARVGIGAYLLYGAPALVRYCTRDLAPLCVRCGYDLSGATGPCPECGLAARPATPPESRRPVPPSSSD